MRVWDWKILVAFEKSDKQDRSLMSVTLICPIWNTAGNIQPGLGRTNKTDSHAPESSRIQLNFFIKLT